MYLCFYMFGLCFIDIISFNIIQNVCNIRIIFLRICCDLVVEYFNVNMEGYWLDFLMGFVILNLFNVSGKWIQCF